MDRKVLDISKKSVELTELQSSAEWLRRTMPDLQLLLTSTMPVWVSHACAATDALVADTDARTLMRVPIRDMVMDTPVARQARDYVCERLPDPATWFAANITRPKAIGLVKALLLTCTTKTDEYRARAESKVAAALLSTYPKKHHIVMHAVRKWMGVIRDRPVRLAWVSAVMRTAVGNNGAGPKTG